MHLIVYTSEYTGDRRIIDQVLTRISRKAKLNNKKLGITGLLFYHQGRFLQMIEGEKQSLDALMSKITGDARHANINVLFDAPQDKRSFSQWNMDSFDLGERSAIDLEEFQTIAEAYKQNLKIDAQVIRDFYEAMLKQAAFCQ